MDFELSDELLAVKELGREFAEKEIAPTAAADDRDHHFRRETFEKMGQLGFFGCVVPESLRRNGPRVSGHGAAYGRGRTGAQLGSGAREHAACAGGDAGAVRHRGTETALDPGTGGCVAHRLLRHHRARRRLRRGFDVHPRRPDGRRRPQGRQDLDLQRARRRPGACLCRDGSGRGAPRPVRFHGGVGPRRRSPRHLGQDGRAGVAHRDSGISTTCRCLRTTASGPRARASPCACGNSTRRV